MMQTKSCFELLDEMELRDSLKSMRPSPDAFEAGVRSRLEAMLMHDSSKKLQHSRDESSEEAENSEWLRLAACVVPFPIVAKSIGGSAPLTLGKFSLYHKLIAYIALPSIGLFLAIGATIYGIFCLRTAQRGPHGDSLTQLEISNASLRWWRSYGWLQLAWPALGFVMIMKGNPLPVFLVLMSSGIATVAFVNRLGKAGLVDRRIIASCLGGSLMSLAQIAPMLSSLDSGFHLIDQSIIPALLLGSGMVLSLQQLPIKNWRAALSFAPIVALIIPLMGFYTCSYWQPITRHTVQSYVESFDKARFHTASWGQWAVAVRWLQQSNVSMDLTKPKQLARLEIDGTKNPYILGNAFEANLIEQDDLAFLSQSDQFSRYEANRWDRLVAVQSLNQPIYSLYQNRFGIYMLDALNHPSKDDLDVLESRLLASLRIAINSPSPDLEEVWAATLLLESIERPCEDKEIRDSVRLLLASLQRTSYRFGMDQGGFASSHRLSFSNEMSTALAVELMDRYGIPDDLNVLALRSYLRPSSTDRLMIERGALRAATRLRVESLPDVPAVTWWDFIRAETNLWIALLVLLLCFFAVFGSPYRALSYSGHPQA